MLVRWPVLLFLIQAYKQFSLLIESNVLLMLESNLIILIYGEGAQGEEVRIVCGQLEMCKFKFVLSCTSDRGPPFSRIKQERCDLA